ncbi:MAG: hypothetical protein JWM14_2419 [Chitinophagaceae bacterium]|nr:hypothetical protein [Chitinophagaceae bacterium]
MRILYFTRCWRLANNWTLVTRFYTITCWRDANKKGIKTHPSHNLQKL